MKLTIFLLFFTFFFYWPLIDGISIRRCPFPGIPAHATAKNGHRQITWSTQNDFYEGEAVEFFCKDERALTYNQQMKIRCQSDGNWSGPLPRCDKILTWDDWQIYTISQMNRKWSPVNVNETCQISSEDWSMRKEVQAFITEVRIETCSDHRLTNESSLLWKHEECAPVTSNFNKITFSCASVNATDMSLIIKLENSTSLSAVSVLVNEGDNCGSPPVPVNGFIASQKNLTFKCKEPFQVDPSERWNTTCDPRTGQWTDVPTCTCPVPELPPHVVQTGRNENSVSYQCTGRFIGNGTLTCDHKGIWTRPNCTCREPINVKTDSTTTGHLNTGNWKVPQEITCPSPPAVPNARIVGRTFNTATYKCDEQLQMIGNETVSCDLSGEWPTAVPFCTCKLRQVENARVKLKNGSVDYECNSGFEMISYVNFTCLTTGKEIFEPRCRCTSPPLPGKAVELERKDKSIKLECSQGFELMGKSIATCDSTGRWSALPKCRCIAPANPSHSSVVERADSFIEYKCSNGSQMIGKSIITCNASGIWSTAPTCQEQQSHSVICLETSVFSVTLICIVVGMLVMLFIVTFMAKRSFQKPQLMELEDHALNRLPSGCYEVPKIIEPIYTELNFDNLHPNTIPEEPVYVEMSPLTHLETTLYVTNPMPREKNSRIYENI